MQRNTWTKMHLHLIISYDTYTVEHTVLLFLRQ